MDAVFWGNFDGLCDKPEGKGSEISSVANVDSVRLRLGAVNNQILFVRDSVLLNCRAQLVELEKEYSSLSVALVYDGIELDKIWDCLEGISAISHVLPLSSTNSSHRVRDLLANRTRPFVPQDLTDGNRIVLSQSEKCGEVYNSLNSYLAQQGCFSDFARIAVTSASELLTNAFYNAKRNPQTGAAVVSDRTVKVRLEPMEQVELTYGRDADYFWLIVRDRFGTLDRATLVRALRRAARERTPILGAGGAGLGIHMLFSWATELNILVEPSRSTTIACKFLLTPRNRIFDAEPSALHVLSSETGWL